MIKHSGILATAAFAAPFTTMAAMAPGGADAMPAAAYGPVDVIPGALSMLAWAPPMLALLGCGAGLLWLIRADRRRRAPAGRRARAPRPLHHPLRLHG